MEKLIFDGKEKQLFKTDDPKVLLLKYKDDTTAFDGIKRAVFPGKGALNCKISALIFKALEQNGISTHYIGPAGEDSQFCKKCKIIPLYVIVRNYITGTTADLLGLEYGFKPKNVVYELRYDNVGLNKPLINDHHAVALKIVTYQELETIYDIVGRANKVLVNIFHKAGIKLVDYRVKLGYAPDGTIILADEISPDTSRLWDEATGECLDKDRFRHDLGYICDNYQIVLDRITNILEGKK